MEVKAPLEQVAQRVREQNAADALEDPIWQRLSRGELDADEDAALRARAAADPAMAERYEAFRPLGPDLQQRLVAQASLELASKTPARGAVLRRVSFGAAVALAAAASLLLVLRRSASPADTDPLPVYALSLTGGERSTRSDTAPPPAVPIELHGGSQLEIVLRPATAVTGPVSVEAFTVRDGQARPWTVPMSRSADGAVRISGDARALLGPATGEVGLAFVVERAGAPPVDPADVVRAAGGGLGVRGRQVIERRVKLLEGD